MADMSEEQRKALMEKLKNMGPEELKEFQKKQCIFCQIVGGKMDAKKVYEDDTCIAVLDINPANNGHMLLMPKEHYAIMPQVPEKDLKHLGVAAKKLSLAVLKALKSEGTTIFVANGLAAGQRAQHFMIHVIPRNSKDGVSIGIAQKPVSDDELRKLRELISNKSNALFGIKKDVVVERPTKKTIGPEANEPEGPEKKKTDKKNEKPQKPKGPKIGGTPSLDDIAALFS